jgi:hypothetical protein
MYSCHLAWAEGLSGEIDSANARIADAIDRWSGVGLVMQHYWEVLGHVHMGLAVCDPKRAWGAIAGRWALLEKHRLLVTRFHRVEANWLRGRSALGMAAAGHDRATMLAEVERVAHTIDKLGLGWTAPFSTSLRAGAAVIAGDKTRALSLLSEAEAAIEPTQIDNLLIPVRQLRGQLLGGSVGEMLLKSADEWRAREGLSSLDILSRVYLPTTF